MNGLTLTPVLTRAKLLHPRQQFLVHSWNSDAARIRSQPQGSFHKNSWRYLVVHHPHHHLLVSENVEVRKWFIQFKSNCLFRYMESKEPTVFTSTYKEGVERVLKGNFAFLCESSMLEYVVQKNCNLTQIGGLVDSKGYGIATPKG
jgi:hypothetical protein